MAVARIAAMCRIGGDCLSATFKREVSYRHRVDDNLGAVDFGHCRRDIGLHMDND